VQRAFILADEQLELRSAAMYGPGALNTLQNESGIAFKPGMSLSEVERMVIVETLKSFSGNKTRTAAVLGISLKTLYNRLNEYRALE
jgi:DNA-binding NtrC family response regulator